jgi:hypothetical protein
MFQLMRVSATGTDVVWRERGRERNFFFKERKFLGYHVMKKMD